MNNTPDKLLIVIATPLEAKGIFPQQEFEETGFYEFAFGDVLITGIGMVNTLVSLGGIEKLRYKVIVNLGIAGVYPKTIDDYHIELTQVVRVCQEKLADFGAEDGETIISFDSAVFKSEEIKSESELYLKCQEFLSHQDLFIAKGLTVNTCTGTLQSSKRLQVDGQVESMEGYAISAWSQINNIPWIQLRAISNVATVRDKSKWKIDSSLKNLKSLIDDMLEFI